MCSRGDACAKNVFQRSCYPDNLAQFGWTCTHKCSVLRSAINADGFSPGSASGRASIALRRPAKAKPVLCWWKLAAEVCSRCSQLCWFACGNDNTNASYSGRTALHPGPRRCAPRAGIRRSGPHTRVVLSTSDTCKRPEDIRISDIRISRYPDIWIRVNAALIAARAQGVGAWAIHDIWGIIPEFACWTHQLLCWILAL